MFFTFYTAKKETTPMKTLRTPHSALLTLFAFPALAANHADFGRLDGNRLVAAPLTLAVRVGETTAVRRDTRLTDADYLAAGFKRVIDEKPAASADGKVVVATGWTETDTAITRQYEEVDAPPEVKLPRKFSKLKIYGAIAQLGAWEKVKAWLEAKEVNGVNGWTAFTLAQEVSEDDALFAPLAEEARQLIGLDEAAFEALLSSCVLED